MSYAIQHLKETAEIVAKIDPADCEKCVAELRGVRERGGRLFILGVGGSAANASHAVNDFRKIAGLECYAPTDNVSELTARTNDEGWAERVRRVAARQPPQREGRAAHPLGRRRQPREERLAQPRRALQLARQVGARVIGLVGKDGGYTAKVADACVIVPTVNPGQCHAALRGFPGRALAPVRLPPRPQGEPDEVGERSLTRAESLAKATKAEKRVGR